MKVSLYGALFVLFSIVLLIIPGSFDNGLGLTYRLIGAAVLAALGVGVVVAPKLRAYMYRQFIGASRYPKHELSDAYTELDIHQHELCASCKEMVLGRINAISDVQCRADHWHAILVGNRPFAMFRVQLKVDSNQNVGQSNPSIEGFLVAYLKDQCWRPTDIVLKGPLEEAMASLREQVISKGELYGVLT
jgi:hypothetical protein